MRIDQVLAGCFRNEDDAVTSMPSHVIGKVQQPSPAKANAQPDPTPEERPRPGHAPPDFRSGKPTGQRGSPPPCLCRVRERFTPVLHHRAEPIFPERRPRASLAVAAYFLDTSTVVKRYVQETGTLWVQTLADTTAGHFRQAVARITDIEMTAAVARRRRLGSLSPTQAGQALHAFRQDFAQQYPHRGDHDSR